MIRFIAHDGIANATAQQIMDHEARPGEPPFSTRVGTANVVETRRAVVSLFRLRLSRFG